MQFHSTDQIVRSFVKALADIISRPGGQPSGRARTILSSGPGGFPEIRDHLGREASELGASVLHLEFAPGLEAKGPAFVAVLHPVDGTPIWTECILWSPVSGPGLLAARGGSPCFGLESGTLVRLPDRPPHVLQAGWALGRRKLASAAKRMRMADPELDVERVTTLFPPTPAEHRLATARRLADRDAAPSWRQVANEPAFELKIGDEILIDLVGERDGRPGGDGAPVCSLRLQLGALMPFMIWLGERRDQWRGWQARGEAMGAEALGRHIGELRHETGRMGVQAFDLDIHRDWMGVDFVAEFPDRTATLGTHRFARDGEARRFKRRYGEIDNVTRWQLFEAACLLAPRDLARLIEYVLRGGSALDRGRAPAPTIH